MRPVSIAVRKLLFLAKFLSSVSHSLLDVSGKFEPSPWYRLSSSKIIEAKKYLRIEKWVTLGGGGNVKVKCTLVQALRLYTGRKAHRGSRGIALPFHDHDTRRGWGVSFTTRPLYTPGKDPVPIVREAGCAQGGLDRWGKSRPQPGFDPRTVQALTSRYTDFATRPTGGG